MNQRTALSRRAKTQMHDARCRHGANQLETVQIGANAIEQPLAAAKENRDEAPSACGSPSAAIRPLPTSIAPPRISRSERMSVTSISRKGPHPTSPQLALSDYDVSRMAPCSSASLDSTGP